MRLFNKKRNKNLIAAPQTGTVISVTETPDPVFSRKILGDGVAILPESDQVVSPVNGTVIQLSDTHHALGIRSDDGLEILLHLGIDTVKLNGSGFTCYAVEGQHVQAGEKLMDMDCTYIAAQGYDTTSFCIITNSDALETFSIQLGTAVMGESPVILYCKK